MQRMIMNDEWWRLWSERITKTNCMHPNPSEANSMHNWPRKFPLFYGTGRFITVFTTASHHSLSWARYNIKSTPKHHIFIRSVLILPSHLYLGLTSGPFHFRFCNQNVICISHLHMHAACPANLTLFNLIRLITLVKNTNYGPPLCAIFSTLLSLHPP